MTIKIEDYQMESHKEGGFDLYRLSETKSGKSVGKETKILMGYNMSAERCVNVMIHENIHSLEIATDLRGYIAQYKKEKTKFSELMLSVS